VYITDKEEKQTQQRPQRLREHELRKLSDKEIDEYSSKIIKELLQSYMEDGEFENY